MTAWLLTWLWQGMAVAAGVSIAFRLLPRVNAATRYVVWWGAFVSLVWLGWSSNDNLSGFGIWDLGFDLSRVQSESRFPPPESRLIQIQALPSWLLTSFLAIWVTVAFIKLFRLVPGVYNLYALNDSCRAFPQAIEEQLPLWQEARTSGRAVRLMLCDKLAGAAVLGLDRPCIALPSSLLGALTLDELDQIILHEHGHVQRRDDWTRLIETLVESALWIHPAAFWIGRRLNLEREVACDDRVVARTGSANAYARCLSRAAEVRGRVVQRVFAPAFFSGRRDLLHRVDRLLDTSRNQRRKLSTVAASVGVCGLAVISVQLHAFPLIGEIVHRPSSIVHRRVDDSLQIGSRRQTPDFWPEAGRGPEAGARSLEPQPRADAARLKTSTTQVAEGPETSSIDRRPSIGEGDDGRWTMDDGRSTMALVHARPIQGVYRTADVQPIPLNREEPNTWQLAGTASAKATAVKTAGSASATAVKTAGVGIGSAARKASLGIASTFRRAGVSLARSF